MLYFLISFVSFVILSKSFTNKPNSLLEENEKKLVSTSFCWKLLSFLASRLRKRTMSLKKKVLVSKVKDEEEERKVCLLDLPDLPLECILEHLPPDELCNVATVCKSLRIRCRSDYLWEKHLKRKWSRVFGDAAYRQWKLHVDACREKEKSLIQNNQKKLLAFFHGFLPFLGSKSQTENGRISRTDDSIVSLYLSLENGSFWFPAQVYNRENGHAGFMLSCYDAQLCYDSKTDTFQARYSPHGRWTIEDNIQWDRVRVPPINSSPNVLHISDCLEDLKPGDHVEIQWRRNKEFPYVYTLIVPLLVALAISAIWVLQLPDSNPSWWYCVIGHLETCQGIGNHCQCHINDKVILEFTQFNAGSRWRQTMINRKNHREQGDEIDGFYGGIRKLRSKEEITRWKKFWPTKIVE